MEQLTLFVFHSREWDPALAERVRLAHRRTRLDVGPPVLLTNDDPLATDYAVAGCDAVVVAEAGVVVWRLVLGQSAEASESFAPGRIWTRREFVAVTAGAAIALVLDREQ